MAVNPISVGAKSLPSQPEVYQSSQEGKTVIEDREVSQGERAYSKEQLEREIDNLNKYLQTSRTHLKFTLHEGLNEYYVQVVDDQTNQVIREVPPKKILDMVEKFHELIGILVDERR
ncbi:flagellar protein FlaG [Brevibacillus thermoruber]|jgi:flagellar protein FlaG|uniref:flagellar protein FlaG n=1 Tax=Brevibacillus thermoruber TaxID=33942 RepID=UPI0040425173